MVDIEYEAPVTLMQTYVFHGKKAWFVSTIDRRSSAQLNPCMYAETLIFEWDKDTRERGEMVFQDEDGEGMIGTHMRICKILFETGEVPNG